jgi:hypothetical protein
MLQVMFPPDQVCAGVARRIAMDGRRGAGEDARRPAPHPSASAASACAANRGHRLGSRWLGVPATELATAVKALYFGTAWVALESHSPVLRGRRHEALADLPTQTAIAWRLCGTLRATRETGQAYNIRHAAAE